MPLDIKTESLWYRNPDGTYTEFRAVAPAIDEELSDTSEAPVQNKVITNALNKLSQDKQNKLTFDSTPTEESDNPVTSQGIKAALDTKLDIPEEPGTSDQVLGLDENLIPHWTNKDNSENYAPVLINSASGKIASFNDGAANRKIRKLDVALEPIQDLHGYDSPWPAGGGANKWDEEWEPGRLSWTGENYGDTTKIRSKGFVPVIAGETYRIVTSNNLQFFYYDSNKEFVSYEQSSKGNQGTITIPTGCDYLRFYTYGTDYGTVYKHDIAINYPSTVTTYAPYSNLCPISGWDSVEVEATGINVWDEEWELGGIGVDGAPIVQTDRIRSKNYCPCVGDTKYYFHIPNKNLRVFFYDADKTYLTFYGYWDYAMAFTSPTNARYFKILGSAAYGTTYNHDISINYPATDHDYHPYAGNTHTIQLGETVYGGTLDVTNGTLTVMYAEYVFTGNEGWQASSTPNRFFVNDMNQYLPYNMAAQPMVANAKQNVISSIFGTFAYKNADGVGYIVTGSTGLKQLVVNTTAATTVADIKAIMTGSQLTYEIETPIVIDLDPVTISTIANQTNNVWADAGDVTVEYAADLKTYIDSKIAAAVAALS